MRASTDTTGRAYSRPAAMVDRQTFIDWWTETATETDATDAPESKLQRSYLDEIRKLPPWLRPFGVLWWQEIQHWRQQSVSARTIRRLKQLAERDLLGTAEHLAGCDPKVMDAWRRWYPVWIRGEVMSAAATDPYLLLPAEQVRRTLLDVESRRKAEAREHAGYVTAAQALFKLSDNGMLIGTEEQIATRLHHALKRRGAVSVSHALSVLGRLEADGFGKWVHQRKRGGKVRFLFTNSVSLS